MSDTEYITGRPYGGCAILWNNTLICNVEPVPCTSKRLCVVKIELRDTSFLLFTLYMSCDTMCDMDNIHMYEEVLCEITSISTSMNIDKIICGGDFNTYMTRINSLPDYIPNIYYHLLKKNILYCCMISHVIISTIPLRAKQIMLAQVSITSWCHKI